MKDKELRIRWYDLCRLNKVEEVMNAVYAKDSGRLAQENLFNENSMTRFR